MEKGNPDSFTSLQDYSAHIRSNCHHTGGTKITISPNLGTSTTSDILELLISTDTLI